MISRVEFYTCFILLTAIVIGSVISTDTQFSDIKRAKIEVLDSILQVQRDSALAKAMQSELKADSIQAILNRKKLDIQIIHKKYETEKKNVLVFGADSSLSYFTRAITH